MAYEADNPPGSRFRRQFGAFKTEIHSFERGVGVVLGGAQEGVTRKDITNQD